MKAVSTPGNSAIRESCRLVLVSDSGATTHSIAAVSAILQSLLFRSAAGATLALALDADPCSDHARPAWVSQWDLPAHPERSEARRGRMVRCLACCWRADPPSIEHAAGRAGTVGF